MSGAEEFLPERDPDLWYPPDGIADSLRPIAMYAQAAPHGLEVILFESNGEPLDSDIRWAWSARRARRITPVLVVVFYPILDGERVTLCGPTHPQIYRAVEVSRAERLARAALDKSSHYAATRLLEKELPELGTSIPGLRNVGLLAAEILTEEIPKMPEWEAAVERAVPLLMLREYTLVEQLGYGVERLDTNTKMLTVKGRNLAVGVFCRENEPFDERAIRFGGHSPVSFALKAAENQQIDWVLLTRSSEIRLCSTDTIEDQGEKEEKKRFVELNLDLLPQTEAGYLPLLFSADALAEKGPLSNMLDTRKAEPTQEEPVATNQRLIGCIGGETIVLERQLEEITLSIDPDNKTVRLSRKAAGRMVEWLISQINGPDDPPPSPTRAPTPGGGPNIPPSPPVSYGKKVKVFDLIQAGLLEARTLLTLTYKGREYYATVTSNGSLEIDGLIFRSPSTACVHITGQVSCSGWTAWKDSHGRSLAYLRDQLKKRQARIGQPDVSRPAPSKPWRKKRTPRQIEGTVWGLIQTGLLEAGTVLTLTNGRKSRVLKNGQLEVDGHSFDSPSGAAKSILHRQNNGWQEWRTPDGRTLDALRQELLRRKKDEWKKDE